MRVLSVLSLSILFVAPSTAQGTIVDGNASWTLGAFPPRGAFAPQPADFVASACGGDSLFESRFLWRTATDPNARPFLDQDNAAFRSSFAGDTAQMTWTDVDLAGLVDASWTAVVNGTGPESGFVEHTMVLTNISNATITGSLFFYVDVDHNALFDDDVTLDGTAFPERIMIGDDELCASCTDLFAMGATSAEVGDGLGLITRLQSSGSSYSLANSGAPFGPGDVVCAFEWQFQMLASSTETAIVRVGYGDLYAGVAGAATRFGVATPGSAGAPTLASLSGPPILGRPFELVVDSGSATAASATLLIGIGVAPPVSFCGITFYVPAPIAALGVPLTGGAGVFGYPASCDPILAGVEFSNQLIVLDPTGPCVEVPVTTSSRLTIVFGD